MNVLCPVPPEAVEAWWAYCCTGIVEAIRQSLFRDSLERVKGLILLGNYRLFVLHDEHDTSPGEIIGVAVAEDDTRGAIPGRNLVYLYIKPGSGSEVLRDAMTLLEYDALRNGLRQVRFFSAREGAARRAQSLGYVPVFTEYVRWLEEDPDDYGAIDPA